MPKIVTTAAGAISDKSRLVIKRQINPELKALHNHVVHNEYHYKQKTTIMEKIEGLKKWLKKIN